MTFEIKHDDLASIQTRDLLALHLAGMHASSPAGSVFALDLSGLQASGVAVWTAWRGEQIACVGALKKLSDDHAEIKSMRAHPTFRGAGAGAAILDHLLKTAQADGVRRVSLETGNGPEFEAALRLYRARGFVSGGPFADYEKTEFNQFLHLDFTSDPRRDRPAAALLADTRR